METWIIDGRRLRALREEADVSYTDFAARIDKHPRHFLKMETQGQQTTGRVLHRIRRALSDALGRDVDFAEFCTSTPVTVPRRGTKRVGTARVEDADAA